METGRQRIGDRLLRNTLFNAGGRLWLIGTNLLLTPLYLSYLGQDRFATWVLFWTLTQYLIFLDMGLGPSLVKHFAEFQAKGDAQSINQAVTTVCCLYLLMGASLLVVLWPVMGWIAARFSLPPDLLQEAVQTFRGGLIVLVVLYFVNLFDALLKGHQRMDLTNLALVVVSVPNVLGSYWVLRQGWGLAGLVVAVCGVYLLQLLLLVLFARRVFPQLRLGRRYVRVSMVRDLFGYGARLQTSRVAELICFHADKVLLGLFVPIRYVTFYDLGAKVSYFLHDLPYIFFNAVFPAASELASRDDHQRLWLLYERGTKYLLLLSLPILFGTWLTAHLILQAWLGHVSADVRRAILFLSTGYWTSISVGMVATVGAGIGWVSTQMRAGLLQSVLNLGCSTGLILAMGYQGALIGTLTALLCSNAYLLLRFCRDFDRSVAGHLKLMLRVSLVNAPPALLSLGYLLWVAGWLPEGDRGAALLAFAGCVGLYVPAYLAAIRWSGILDRVDCELLGDYVPMLHSLLRAPT
jgi:O-antigen/teichoic acid export membrane protein